MMTILWAFVAFALVVHLAGLALTGWRLTRKPAPLPNDATLPFTSFIRPVCGLDAHDPETLVASFAQDHPRFELIFCAEREDDPAVALLRRLIAAHPTVEARLLVGALGTSGNPKLDNLEKGIAAARGEWLALTDANLLPPPDYLRRLAAAWTPGTGLVSAPVVGTRPGNLWGAVECAFLNTDQARWLIAGGIAGLDFAEGKTLYTRRDILEAAGGVAALGAEVAEDLAAARMMHRIGLRVRHTDRLFTQPVGRRSLRAVWARQLRWARIRRIGVPAIFLIEAGRGSAPVLAALALLVGLGAAPGWSLPALAAFWWGAEWALAARLAWPHGPRDVLAMALRDLIQPALWIASWTGRGFSWHGKAMDGQRPGALPPDPGQIFDEMK